MSKKYYEALFWLIVIAGLGWALFSSFTGPQVVRTCPPGHVYVDRLFVCVPGSEPTVMVLP